MILISTWGGNANYLTDKATVENGMPSGERMLARSEAKSVGSAGGSGSDSHASKTELAESISGSVFENLGSKEF